MQGAVSGDPLTPPPRSGAPWLLASAASAAPPPGVPAPAPWPPAGPLRPGCQWAGSAGRRGSARQGGAAPGWKGQARTSPGPQRRPGRGQASGPTGSAPARPRPSRGVLTAASRQPGRLLPTAGRSGLGWGWAAGPRWGDLLEGERVIESATLAWWREWGVLSRTD